MLAAKLPARYTILFMDTASLPWRGFDEIIDVRSPAEYADDCIPGAVNMPALSNEERAEIGALHQASPFAARRRGAGMVAANIAAHLRAHLESRPPEWRPLVYCWRGGQRSGAVTEVLRQVGWDASRLEGGYKAYRRAVMEGIQHMAPRVAWRVIGGKTGAGKTAVLSRLERDGEATLDLEDLGNHRGSAFGDNGAQPSQRRFESMLFDRLCALQARGAPTFVEAEGRKIGALHVPKPMLAAMRAAPVFYLEASPRLRAKRIVADYPMMKSRDCFDAAADAIGRFAGARRRDTWKQLHESEEWENLAEDLLVSFYDVGYEKSLTANYPRAAGRFDVDPVSPDAIGQTARLLAEAARRPLKFALDSQANS